VKLGDKHDVEVGHAVAVAMQIFCSITEKWPVK